jgi:DNA-binding response OmpR family regulator
MCVIARQMTAPRDGARLISTMARYRVLVVDDEAMVTEVIERYLIRDGFDVSTTGDGDDAVSLTQTWAPDLIVLDLMLPGIDGFEVCRAIRRDSKVPIIMLTARGEETDRIVGLEIGADDYMVKPFSPRELVARVKAVLRRAASAGEPHHSSDVLRFAGLILNPRTRTVEINSRPALLTAKEFDLLYFLASHPNQVFTREQLMDDVWDYTFAGDSSTVTVHVRRLREKIEPDPMRPRYVKTVWGVGYKFES